MSHVEMAGRENPWRMTRPSHVHLCSTLSLHTCWVSARLRSMAPAGTNENCRGAGPSHTLCWHVQDEEHVMQDSAADSSSVAMSSDVGDHACAAQDLLSSDASPPQVRLDATSCKCQRYCQMSSLLFANAACHRSAARLIRPTASRKGCCTGAADHACMQPSFCMCTTLDM